ncbi:MAG: MBL fold metallo-hydrolase, partial [Gemmatimonadaceae bacterium]
MPAHTPFHHRPGGGFRNPWPSVGRGRPADFARWIIRNRIMGDRRAPDRSVFPLATPSFASPRAAADELSVTWVGHASALIQVGGLNILTDPIWSERCSPFPFAGPRRWAAPGVAFDALPPLDAVLLSHNHYDHLDAPTVRRLAVAHPAARWLVPLGLARLVRELGVREASELDWGDETCIRHAAVACTPARHFSARGLRDRDRTLWCSWSVNAGAHRVFFGGDSGFHPDFATIGAAHGPFDVALLPIGAYDPRVFMRDVHMNPEEAVRAFLDLHAAHGTAHRAVMVPIHWGTFKLTDEPMDEPPRRAREAWENEGLPGGNLWVLRQGETGK